MRFMAHVKTSLYFSIWGFIGSFRILITGLRGNVQPDGSSTDLWLAQRMPVKSLKEPAEDKDL